MVTRPQPPSERDLALLSAYLDGELNDRERVALEKRLSQESALRAALEGLRETVTLVRSLPRLKAPRNFTLDPAVYGQPVPWWRRLFTLGTVLQVSGAFGAAASIMIITLAFLLGGQSDSENRASVSEPLHAEVEQQTAVGYAAGTVLPTPTQPPAVSPTASMAKVFTPTQHPFPTATLTDADQDGAFGAGAADSAIMPTSEAAILIEPATSEQESFAPPAAGEQPAEESAAPEDSAENGVFAAPEPAAAQAYDDAGEAEVPMLIETPTGTPVVEASSVTSLPSPTQLTVATAAEEGREKDGSDDTAMRWSEEDETEDNNTRWLVAGLGAVMFVLSVGLFIAGRRKR